MRVIKTTLFDVLLLLAFLSGVALAQDTEAYVPEHPLDALTTEEINAAAKLLRRAGLASNEALFPTLTLREPEKAFVRAWRTGEAFSRQAFVVIRDKGQTTEAVIDLQAEKVLSSRIVPGAQPMIMDREWARARDAFQSDARFLAALQKRGLDVTRDDVFCTPNSAGFFPGDTGPGRRILKVPCFSGADSLHPSLARPIEGIMGIVDSETGDILDVIDRPGAALSPAPDGYGAKLPTQAPAILPLDLVSPQGSNIDVSGNLNISWLNWSFHARADKRAGLILSLVRFHDGKALRDIAYQMNVSEMFVPYMDPDLTWAYRTFMDVGEFGLGYLISRLQPGVDCPRNALYADLTFPNDQGGSFVRPRAVCIFERNTGDPAWRHYSSGNASVDGQPQVELVLRHIPTLGNYDYVVDYVFTPQGNIRLRVGASGFDAIKTVAAKDMKAASARDDTRYGNLIAPYTVAPFHDHYFNFRLDLDVDGPGNSMVRSTFRPEMIDGPRKSIWTLSSDTLSAEGPVIADHSMVGGQVLRIVNPSAENGLGQNTSYWLNMHHDATSLLAPDDPPQTRAQFSAHSIWVSTFKPDELWAAGPYPNLSVKDEGLPAFVTPPEAITAQDVVVWYTMGFRHVTRPEDFPILPTFWHELTLRPAFFFDMDPSMTFNSGLDIEAQ